VISDLFKGLRALLLFTSLKSHDKIASLTNEEIEMKAPAWNELQEMFNTEEAFGTISEMVENLADSPSEDNLLCLAQFIIETYIENQK
jgi:hypothetical protein